VRDSYFERKEEQVSITVEEQQEAEWSAWLAKNCAEDTRRYAARVKAMKWVASAALLAAVSWSYLAP
jgi:hypothetical protein